MKIETKYDIGQEVWTMLCGEPEFCTIEGISITHTKLRRWGYNGFHAMYDEIFSTKEELLKSL